ncbi:hypothetical protein STCU_05461 [Strigomonas culicis]|uniref:Uncharacterized protein n=1 Tax=Strigomonas culicis TaxID=28005 RepID=S9UAQ5_9TRYP|nr:hypothetical protein STCU_05461 [Strigomonas culicis]|eukprot:EPY27877.1 hypothetical protein STCU_05461 [Strigomonas culicis]
MMDKKWEYLSCEGSDILMQVMLDKEAFPEPARRAAATALDALVSTAFKSVIKKLVHWISDEREDDDPEQLQRERQLAVTRLTRMVTSATYRAHWTEELQSEVLDLIQRVLGTVDAREFTQLVRIVSHLPICKERHGVPLLELFLSKYDLNSERHLESVTIIGRYVKEGAEFDLLPYLEKSKLLAKPLGSDAHAVLLSRLVLLATRVATSDNAELLFEYVFGQLSALVGTDEALPDNLSVVEALLLAATNIARKKPAEVLHKLHEDALNVKMVSLVKAVEKVEPEAIFAVKKHVISHEVKHVDREVLATIHNIKLLAGAISSKHLPMDGRCA